MIYTDLTRKAMNIAYNAHHGQVDQVGVPYIFHPVNLAEQMEDEMTTCVALLHDVVEDTDVTFEELEKEFPTEVIDALRLLTHTKDVPYNDYVRCIKENPIAKTVKYADLKNNMDESRYTEEITEEQRVRWKKKYTTALKILNGENDE